MQKMLACCGLAMLCLALPLTARAENDQIDPKTYICAELLAQPTTDGGQPPVFEALQIDGYASALAGQPVADPESLAPMLGQVFAACQPNPAEKVLAVWQKARKSQAAATDGKWRADKTTCADYNANPDDGSGFVIWLDGYHRAKSGKDASVLSSDQALKSYLDACAKKPTALMLDVMDAQAR
ncbi:HdeA/HdeB family chaperone [Desulfovibrio legallii]|uniref:HdeA/HdeB family protein n=1 Tax=Desulfovibrio legallii TaxID=571438 RepID=A0A1G7M9K2_9BACT|nr:HdeA/HdeB family chaperone [Desulfovibrio legallii]SDF58415.1 HdeA/HdeB family protein [Desulfovibrio legallii]